LIRQNIANIADSLNIPLDNFIVDKDALNEQFEGWDVDVKVNPVLPNGIDLLNRPQVSAEDMWANGWTQEKGYDIQ